MVIHLIDKETGKETVSASIPDMRYPADLPDFDKWFGSIDLARDEEGNLYRLSDKPRIFLRHKIRFTKGNAKVKRRESQEKLLKILESKLVSYRDFRHKEDYGIAAIYLDMKIAAAFVLSEIRRIVHKCRKRDIPEEEIVKKFGRDASLLKNF